MISLLMAAAVVASPPPLVRQYDDVALSPKGDRVASIETIETGEEIKKPHGHIVVRATKDGAILAEIDPCPGCTYDRPAFSPDGKSLAFIADDRAHHHAALQVSEDGKVRTVASVDGLMGAPRWSPDGKSLASLATVGARKMTGAVEAGIPQVGEIGETNDEQRIALVPASGGELKLVSPADTFIYEYDWTPDGKGFIATAAKGNGDNNWWVAKLVAVDAATGELRVVASPKVQINSPRVSPDGKSVVFIGGLMSDFMSVGGDVYAVPLAGGEPANLTPGYAASFTALNWRGKTLYATAIKQASTALMSIDPAGKAAPQLLWSAPASVGGFDARIALSADAKTAAFSAQDFEHGPRLMAGAPKAPKAITHDNDALPAFTHATSVAWKSDGYDVQGWLLAPTKVEAGKTYAMIVQIHGGPSSAAMPNFVSHGTTRDLLEHGYWVFMPNPRGSYGQGEAFTRANIKDFGGGDLKDILAGVDAVEKSAPIDDKRLGVFGHSYGGYMTMWTVTHSQRFHAAVSGAGIANWVSYYGENGIDQWMIPFFGASAYDDPSVYDRLSPIRSIRDAKTPTFIYVGERDVECPAPQSQEFWHGLKDNGTPTSLVIYEGEGHRLRQPEHINDLAERIVGWFDKYL